MLLHGGNKDLNFFEDEMNTYGGIKFNILQNLMEAKFIFESEYGDQLYKSLAKYLKVDVSNLDFFTTKDYLEDYITAKFNNKRTPYNFDHSTNAWIEIYYKHYYRLGVFKDHAYLRVFTHTYFTNLVKELLLKAEADQEATYIGLTNIMLDTMGLSLHFSNYLTFLAVMHQLGEVEDYFPSFGDELKWTLFYSAGRYWVRGEYESKKLTLQSKANSEGDISLDDFVIYICSKLYFGNLKMVESGIEDPHDKLDSPNSCRGYFDSLITAEEEIFETKLDQFGEETDYSNTVNINEVCPYILEVRGKESAKKLSPLTYPRNYILNNGHKEVIYVDSIQEVPEEYKQSRYISQNQWENRYPSNRISPQPPQRYSQSPSTTSTKATQYSQNQSKKAKKESNQPQSVSVTYPSSSYNSIPSSSS
jgi:hypothetical protein